MPNTLFDQGYPRPHFVDRDPMALTLEIIERYEQLVQRKLYPAQIERLLVNLQAYEEAGVRTALQITGELNLVSFSHGIYLDYLGELVGCFRLEDTPSRCTLRFTLDRVPNYPVTVPAGARVTAGTGAGQIVWATVRACTIKGALDGGPTHLDDEGLPYVEVPAEADTNGTVGNGFLPGEINILLDDPFDYFLKVENTDQTRQGAAVEDDERFRRRVQLAPEGFTGGSEGAYQYYALSVSPYIVDVSAHQETPGHLIISPLVRDGLPSQDILSQIAKALRPDKRRPLTDWPTVTSPVMVPVSIDLTVTPFQGWDTASLEQRIRSTLRQFIAERLPKLGIDIVPSQIVSAVGQLAGVYRVQVNSPSYQTLEVNEWAAYSDQFQVAIAPAEAG